MSSTDPARLFGQLTSDAYGDRSWREREAGHLLDWAAGSASPAGGFGWRLSTGALDPARGRPLWISCRMIHCLALGHLLGHDSDGARVDAGIAALRREYQDQEHGGWFADADRPGEGRKEAYGHAFVVLAGASATVAGRPGGRQLLDEALALVLERFWDTEAQMPFESWDVAFTELEDYRGGNAAMHLVEAFLAAADATGDAAWRERALAICERMLSGARDLGWRVPEHFDARWQVRPDYNIDEPRHPFRPYGATPGHAFEWAWLVLTLRAAHPTPPWFLEAAVGLVDTAWADAWDVERGGLAYTTDAHGEPVVRERFHWVACEAPPRRLGAASRRGRGPVGDDVRRGDGLPPRPPCGGGKPRRLVARVVGDQRAHRAHLDRITRRLSRPPSSAAAVSRARPGPRSRAGVDASEAVTPRSRRRTRCRLVGPGIRARLCTER